jgi:hypothetical protein
MPAGEWPDWSPAVSTDDAALPRRPAKADVQDGLCCVRWLSGATLAAIARAVVTSGRHCERSEAIYPPEWIATPLRGSR